MTARYIVGDGWAEIEACHARWLEQRETTARVCAELRTERLMPPALGCIARVRRRGLAGRFVPTPISRRWRRRVA